MLATFCRLIWWRYVPKNHSLSRTIGPPNEGLTSHSFWIEFAAVSPFACTSDVRLLPWNELPVPLTKKVPANRLPPCLPTRFICGPPVVASPSPPLRLNTTSCELPTSGT
ncbi:MAG: hypothetical protein DMF94_21035 [Acidobacteria bacterium]|nr:MAG: hypothetical protein DMF94_21035 [Acidobacteriota bacterium]